MFGFNASGGAGEGGRNKRRFNLLMLEEREYYFEDYAAFLHPGDDAAAGTGSDAAPVLASLRRIKGRLHVCSKNLIFDPDTETGEDVLRVPFRDMVSIRAQRASGGLDAPFFDVHARSSVSIPNNAPYTFRKHNPLARSSHFYFTLSYVELDSFLAFVNQLHGLYKLPSAGSAAASGSSGPTRQDALQEIIRIREERISFNSAAIVDLRERVLLRGGQALLARQITPLLECPGRLQVTDQRLYWQNFYALAAAETVWALELANITRIYRRRYVMRDCGIEIFYRTKRSTSSSWQSSAAGGTESVAAQRSCYFVFHARDDREMVYTLLHQAIVGRNGLLSPSRTLTASSASAAGSAAALASSSLSSLPAMISAWLGGKLSNFEYLLYLNQCAGRSYQDLTQYIVFPWVLSDYTSEELDLSDPGVYRDLSKPIGALNPERLESFRRRMREMPEEIHQGHPYLYGTHYSCPGYVLFYLVRKAPQFMLKLQNGRFDQPDRLFHSIASTWQSVLNAPTDLKELIPEFFALEPDLSMSGTGGSGSYSSPGEWLVNSAELDLGVRQTGEQVDDVELPPWADGSTRTFIQKMRQALESEYVSQHLHEWIDLIFGFKQTGEAARAADNVFYHLTYEGAVDLDAITDEQKKRSILLQINEFGQTPRQLFFQPHPQKRSKVSEDEIERMLAPASGPQAAARSSPALAAERGSAAAPSPRPSPHPSPAPSEREQRAARSSAPSPAATAPSLTAPPPALNVRSPSGPPIVTSSVSPLTNPLSPGLASSTSPFPLQPQPPLTLRTNAELNHIEAQARALQLAEEVASIQTKQLRLDNDFVSPANSGASAAASSSSVSPPAPSRVSWPAFDASDWTRIELLSLHRDAVAGLALTADGESLLSVGADGFLKSFSISQRKVVRSAKISDMNLSACALAPDGKHVIVASWDGQLHIYSPAFGRVVNSAHVHDDAVTSMSVSGNTVLTGSWDTTLKVFPLREGCVDTSPLHRFNEHDASVLACCLDSNRQLAASGSEDGALLLWDLRVRGARARHLEALDVAIKSIDICSTLKTCIVTAEDGSLRQFDISTGRLLTTLDAGAPLTAARTDGEVAVVASTNGTLSAWGLRARKQLMSIDTQAGKLGALAISNDASLICVGGQKIAIYQHK